MLRDILKDTARRRVAVLGSRRVLRAFARSQFRCRPSLIAALAAALLFAAIAALTEYEEGYIATLLAQIEPEAPDAAEIEALRD